MLHRYSLGKGGKTMDEISKLLKEARPLYFARKKRNERIRTIVVMLVCVVMLSWFYPKTENLEYDYNYLLTGSDTSVSDNTASIIEEMGLPTDEFGLLLVG